MTVPRKYNDEWILANYNRYPFIKDLTDAYNKQFSDNLTRRVLACHCERKLGLYKDCKYTKEQDAWLRDNFSRLGRKECVNQFNKIFGTSKSEEAIKVRCNKILGLSISKVDKKRHRVDSSQPSEHEFVTSQGYTMIKDGNKYVTKQRYVYEKAFGKIPKGNSVLFLDGDKQNFELNNLICVPTGYIRAVMYQRYSKCIKPEEVKDAKVRAKINREFIELYALEKELE